MMASIDREARVLSYQEPAIEILYLTVNSDF